jgi:drug/metabolite transporter (DMT)-like permease
MAVKNSQLQHNILSVGRSVQVIGGFYAFLTAFVVIITFFGGVSSESWSLFIGGLLTLLLAAFWMVIGTRIRREVKRPQQAIKLIAIVTCVAVAFFAINIFETVLTGVNTGIVITTVFALYMIWSYVDIRDRIKGKK